MNNDYLNTLKWVEEQAKKADESDLKLASLKKEFDSISNTNASTDEENSDLAKRQEKAMQAMLDHLATRNIRP